MNFSKLTAVSLLLSVSAQAWSASIFYGAIESKETQNEFCHVSVSVPQVASAQGQELAPGLLMLNNQWGEQLESEMADYKNAVSEPEACTDFFNSYQANLDFTVATPLSSRIASVVQSYYYFTGGAHGNGASLGTTFDSQTGEVYRDMSAFFEDSGLETFKAKLEERLKEQYKDGFDPEFGWIQWKDSMKSMSDIGNFYFDADGLVIYFNSYDIAPYAAGPMDIVFFWWELSELGLKKEGPALYLPKGE